jgi:DNA-directed RNA polymerase subunit RPC12/RpoP
MKMINCNTDLDKASYGNEVFCKTCGMDIEFNPVKKIYKGITQLYCCDNCAKIR